ncbi:MAG: hypothetical protein ABIR30_05060 [Chitinophagaceae bacterium]
MKTLFLLLSLGICFTASAQLKTTTVCNPFVVDILGGKVTGIEPDFTQAQVKQVFPCFTSEEAETSSSKCGGLIAYKDKDIYFYTGRDYIEIGQHFKGKMSLPLMGASRNSLFKWLGHPKIKDVKWDAFQTQYGTLVLYYNSASKINKIQFSTKSTETIQLCE